MMIFDIEADGLLEEVTKAHIFAWTLDGNEVHTTTNPQEFIAVLNQHEFAGAHNSFRYDFPLLRKLYEYKYKGIKIDTLWLSWVLFPRETKHGLDEWGKRFNVRKVEVAKDQWSEGDIDLMSKRCEQDIRINWLLWQKQLYFLSNLYD